MLSFRLPEPMRAVARELDGQTITLKDAMNRISPIAESLGGKSEIVDEYNYISFENNIGTYNNIYCLIRCK